MTRRTAACCSSRADVTADAGDLKSRRLAKMFAEARRRGDCGRQRASNKGFLEISFVEHLELLDALARRERIEKAGGASSDIPPVLERLGVTASQWEHAVTVTSRRFARELDIMAMMFAETRRRS